jgi:hypothetical protein
MVASLGSSIEELLRPYRMAREAAKFVMALGIVELSRAFR